MKKISMNAIDSDQFIDNNELLVQLLNSIVDRHIITKVEYENYRDAFWGSSTVYEHPISHTDLSVLIQSAGDDDFIQFTFSSIKTAKDFNAQVVENHVFNSYVSCFTVFLFQKIDNDPTFQSLSITKGIKHLTRSATCPYDGDFTVALLIYKSKDIQGNDITQFFDIVEDPTK